MTMHLPLLLLLLSSIPIHRNPPVSIVLLRHMSIYLEPSLERLHTHPAHVRITGRTLHMIAPLSLLYRHTTRRAVSDVVLSSPPLECFRACFGFSACLIFMRITMTGCVDGRQTAIAVENHEVFG
jgi:hypothetical protein